MSYKKYMQKGFSLLEVVVVVAILAIMSVYGVVNIVEFQKNAILDSTAQEFVSALKTAKNKSMSGEVNEGDVPSDYVSVGDQLPRFGVSVTASTYSILIDYIKSGVAVTDPFDTVNLDTNLTMAPVADIYFERKTGETASTTFTLTRSGGTAGRQIDIDSQGLITITKL